VLRVRKNQERERKNKLEITLQDLMDWIMKGIVLILVLSLLCGAGAFLFAKYFIAPTYVSEIKLYAGEKTSDVSGVNSYKSVAPQYIEFLNVLEFYERISLSIEEKTGKKEDPEKIANQIEFSSIISNTASFYMTVTTTDPQLSYDVAMAVAELAPQQIKEFQTEGSLEVVSYPVFPMEPAGPDMTKVLILGLFFGAFLGVAVVVLREMMDTSIKTAEEITEVFGLPVFGIVPDFSANERRMGR